MVAAVYGTARYGFASYSEAVADPGPVFPPDTGSNGANWSMVAHLPAGGPALGDLTGATGRKATFRLDAPSTVSWSMRGSDPAAALIEELVTDVVLWRNDTPMVRARCGATSDAVTPTDATVECSAVDYRAILARRTSWTDGETGFTADPGSVAWALVAGTQSRPGGNLGITRGRAQAIGVVRDVTFPARQPIQAAIDQMAHMSPGFDWDISPTLSLDIWPGGRGRYKEYVAHYGSTVSHLSRSFDPSTYANALWLSGAAGTGTVTRTVADIEDRPEGRWEASAANSDVTSDASVDARADWALREQSSLRPSYRVTLTRGAWSGPGELWLGDTCRLVVKVGRLDVGAVVQVVEIGVDIDDDGGETVSVTFELPERSLVGRLTDHGTRIDRLERAETGASISIAAIVEDTDLSGGLFTAARVIGYGDFPTDRSLLVGWVVAVESGPDVAHLWTVTDSGPCAMGAALHPGELLVCSLGQLGTVAALPGETVPAGIFVYGGH